KRGTHREPGVVIEFPRISVTTGLFGVYLEIGLPRSRLPQLLIGSQGRLDHKVKKSQTDNVIFLGSHCVVHLEHAGAWLKNDCCPHDSHILWWYCARILHNQMWCAVALNDCHGIL